MCSSDLSGNRIRLIVSQSRYGSVAILPPVVSSWSSSSIYASGNKNSSILNPADGVSIQANNPQDSITRTVRLNSDLSALSIRATEYLQRWKEVVQFASKDYSDQMRAQFGIKAPEYMGNHAHYIGGWTNVININEVLNTNLESDNSQAVIAGKGVGSMSGHTLTYDCGAEHQVIMCVYHAYLS